MNGYWIFSLIVILDAYRDHLVFHRPYDNGYWSLHTVDTSDAWHHSKLLFWLLIILGFIYVKPFYSPVIEIISYAVINFVLHEVMLHFKFRMNYGFSFKRCLELYIIKWKKRINFFRGL